MTQTKQKRIMKMIVKVRDESSSPELLASIIGVVLGYMVTGLLLLQAVEIKR